MPSQKASSFADDLASLTPSRSFADDLAALGTASHRTTFEDDLRAVETPPPAAAVLPGPARSIVRSEVTALVPQDEQRFQSWAKANQITDVDHPNSFYDYRGYWKDVASTGVDQRKRYDDGLHFPDTYKQHGHPTFSIESKYSTGPKDGGMWQGETFIPRPSAPLKAEGYNGPATVTPAPQKRGIVDAFRNPGVRPIGPVEQIVKGVARGAVGIGSGLAEDVVAVARLLPPSVPGIASPGAAAKALIPAAEAVSQAATDVQRSAVLAPSATAEKTARTDPLADPSVLADPDWWLENASEGVGSQLAFWIPMGVVNTLIKTPAAVAKGASLVARAKRLLTASRGVAAGAALEAAVEAGGQQRDALEKGEDPQRAAELAAKAFAAQFTLLMATAVPGYVLPQASRLATRVAAGGAGEAAQEYGQEVVANVVAKEYDPARPVTQGAAAAGIVGGLLGMGGGAGTRPSAEAAPVAPPAPPSAPTAPKDVLAAPSAEVAPAPAVARPAAPVAADPILAALDAAERTPAAVVPPAPVVAPSSPTVAPAVPVATAGGSAPVAQQEVEPPPRTVSRTGQIEDVLSFDEFLLKNDYVVTNSATSRDELVASLKSSGRLADIQARAREVLGGKFTVYRAGDDDGQSFTLRRDVAEAFSRMNKGAPVRSFTAIPEAVLFPGGGIDEELILDRSKLREQPSDLTSIVREELAARAAERPPATVPDNPVAQRLEAERREIERRVQAGESPTGEERRAASEPVAKQEVEPEPPGKDGQQVDIPLTGKVLDTKAIDAELGGLEADALDDSFDVEAFERDLAEKEPAEARTDPSRIPLTRGDVEDMLQRAWNADLKDYYDPNDPADPKNWREWVRDTDTYNIALTLDSNFEIYDRYLRDLTEDVTVHDVIEAYKRGELTTVAAQKAKTLPVPLANVPFTERGGIGEPRAIAAMATDELKTLWATASERATPTNKVRSLDARKAILIQAHIQPLHTALGVPRTAITKALRQWSNYPMQAQALDARLNKDVPAVSQWTGLQNLAFLNRVSVKPAEVDAFVKTVEAPAKSWNTPDGESLRAYLVRAFLGLDTRIDYSDLTIRVNSTLKPRGQYSGRAGNPVIEIRESSPHTVVHELGHYLDQKWAKELGVDGYLSDLSFSREVAEGKTSKERIQWAERFQEFIRDISGRSDIGSEYLQSRKEVFARFADKFVQWAEKQAGGRTWGGDSYREDRFQASDFTAFVKLLQEKAFVDAKDGNPLSGGTSSGETVSKPQYALDKKQVTLADLTRVATRRRVSVDSLRKAAEKAGYTVIDDAPRPVHVASDRDVPPAKSIPPERLLEFPSIQKMPAAIQGDIADLLAKYQGFEAQRRGVQPIARTQELAKDVWLPLETLRPGTALNAEELEAYKTALATALTERQVVLDKIKDDTATDWDKLQFSHLTDVATILTASYRGAKAEAGRALNVLRVKARVLDLQESRFLEAALRAPGFQKDLMAVSKAALDAQGDPLKQLKFLRSRAEADWFDVFQAVYYANLLSGMKTHLRNAIGNSFNVLANTLTPVGAAAADVARTVKTGQERSAFLGEIPQNVIGGFIGLHRGWQNAVFTFSEGFRPSTVAAATTGVFDTPRPELKGGIKNPFNWPGRSLEAADEFFRAIAFHQELYAGAYAKARTDGARTHAAISARMAEILAGTAGPDAKTYESIAAKADVFAARAVFQEEPGAIVQWLLKAKAPTSPKSLRLLSLFMSPFIKTPSAILRQGAEWSPAGFAMKGVTAEGGDGQRAREQSQAAGRALLGTAFLLGPIAWLAATGRLTGAPPDDPGDREEFYAQGKLANAVRIGDYWVRYVLFQPFSVGMAAIANAWEQFEDSEQDEGAAEEALLSAIAGAGASLLDQSFLAGLGTFIDAINEPQRYAGQWWRLMAQGFVPFSGLMRNITQATDPVYRKPQGTVESLKAIIPGQSSSLPARRTRFGEEAKAPGGAIRRGFLVPEVSKAIDDEVTATLARLKVQPITPQAKFTLRGKDIQLTREQQDAVIETLGRERKLAVHRVIYGPGFARMPEEQQRVALERAINGVTERVRPRVLAAVAAGRPITFDALASPAVRAQRRQDQDALFGKDADALAR